MITIITLIITSILVYFPLYYWRNLSFALKSFICFAINVIIFDLYLVSTSLFLFFTDKNHIYLDDLSNFSKLKYLIFILAIIVCGIMYLILKLSKEEYLTKIYNFISYPYLKEQTCEVFQTFTKGRLGDISDYILEYNYSNTYFKYCFFILHFLFLYGFRILRITLFVNFAFLGGDLRYLLLLLPLSCLIWLGQHWDYYFSKYLEKTMFYCHKVFTIKTNIDPNINNMHTNKDTINLYWDNLTISITDFGYAEGYLNNQLDILKLQWLKLANFRWMYSAYKDRLQGVNKILLITRVICWVYIIIYFYA